MEIGGGSNSDRAGKNRILLVEDDDVISRLVERAFVRLGYGVHVAKSCAEAHRVSHTAFQCGVFDIELKDGDGIAVASALLAGRTVRTVVFYTGSLDGAARARAGRVGRVIDKLSPFDELKNHVAELMSSRGRDPGARERGDT